MKKRIVFFMTLSWLISGISYAQEVQIKIGIKDSIQSILLDEYRPIVVSLPEGYETTTNSYPVLYLLDGTETGLLNAITVTRKLRAEMIIVAIPNIDRDRDMMPLSTPTYKVDHPRAEHFLSFLEKELLPHIESNYRSNGQRTIRGASLSGLFVMYAFLEKPAIFDNYIGNSAGWYADMSPFFSALIHKAFKSKEQFYGKKLFVANSLADRFDPNQEVHHEMLEFAKILSTELGDKMRFQYQTYENYGHVPFPSFYDGLKFVLELD